MDNFTPHQLLLMKLRDEFCAGNAAELARRIKKDSTYVNRLFYPEGKNGKKGIGLEIMEACSIAFNLKPGYWDMPHTKRLYSIPDDVQERADKATRANLLASNWTDAQVQQFDKSLDLLLHNHARHDPK
jgi:hypothetical protein